MPRRHQRDEKGQETDHDRGETGQGDGVVRKSVQHRVRYALTVLHMQYTYWRLRNPA